MIGGVHFDPVTSTPMISTPPDATAGRGPGSAAPTAVASAIATALTLLFAAASCGAGLALALGLATPEALVAVFAATGFAALLGWFAARLPADAGGPARDKVVAATAPPPAPESATDLEGVPLPAALVDREGCIRSANAALGRVVARGTPAVGRPLDHAVAGALGRFRAVVADRPAGADGGLRLALLVDTSEGAAEPKPSDREQKMQAVGRLAGGVAHDLNNVMTAIIGWCDLLLQRHRPSDASFRDIINIKQSANRAAALVRQLLAFSSRQTLQPKALRLNDVIAELAIMLDRLRGPDVALEIDHGRDLWPVMGDHGQIEQVITNLVVNARDAMQGRGSLAIRTRNVAAPEVAAIDAEAPRTDCVLIEVADTGPGISDDVIDRIFDPFFSTKPFGEGTGLGLATVYGIIQQSGGSISVDSSPRGTTFRILLPRLTEAAAEPAGAGPAATAPQDRAIRASPATRQRTDLTGSAAILLVEDDEAIRALSAKALENQGYTVYTAASGEDAIAVMRERAAEIDLLITDVLMPEMDGPTLAAAIRQIKPDVRLILMSGYAETPIDRDRIGDYAFLPKPFELKQLAARAKEALESARDW